jgi:hypothetical protein
MRKRLLLAVVALGLGAVLIAPAAAVGQVPTQDSVTGTGQSSSCGGAVEVDARSGPSGENPSGFVNCGTLFSGPVSCLNVQGNVALLNVESSTFGRVAVRITDNGPGGVDLLDGLPGTGCPQPGSYIGLSFVGDLVVVDAQPGRARLRVANLTGAAERPGPGDPDGRGSAFISLNRTAGEVCFLLNWRRISTPTAAHIHVGNRTEAGPVVVTLFQGTPVAAGCVSAPRALISQINATPRKYYVNIHTADFPDGAIRGQLRRPNRGLRQG